MTPEERFNQNQKLVPFIYAKYFQQDSQPWKDDLIQEGLIALWKSCKIYDETQGFLFSTLACACIHRAMCTYLKRKVLRHSESVSFEEIVSEDADGNQIRLKDCIASKSDLLTPETQHLLGFVLSLLPKRTQQVSLLILQGYRQEEIGDLLGVSQSTVARDWDKFKEKFKRCLEETK